MQLYAVSNGKRYGYARQDGSLAIPHRFTKLPTWGSERFAEGRAIAYEGNTCGFIDEEGAWVVPPEYDDARPFSEGLAMVAKIRRKRWRWWFVDRDGNRRGAAEGYIALSSFREGRAFVQVEPSRAWMVDDAFDRVGTLEVVGRPDDKSFGPFAEPFHEGRALVRAIEADWGFVDRDGGWAVEPRYSAAQSYAEGLAAVRTADNEVLFIDREGVAQLRYPIPYLALASFAEGVVLTPDPDDSLAKAYVDREGNIRIPARREHAGYFSAGRARWVEPSGKQGFIDASGSLVIAPTYGYAEPFRDGLARVVPDLRKPRSFVYIDPSGAEVIASRGR